MIQQKFTGHQIGMMLSQRVNRLAGIRLEQSDSLTHLGTKRVLKMDLIELLKE